MPTNTPGQTPVDFKVVRRENPLTRALTIDFEIAPNGDLAVVTGIDLLVQTVTRWVTLRVGAYPFRPTYGNPILDLPGQAAPADPSGEIVALLQVAEATFLQAQAQAASRGQLSPTETATAFGAAQVARGPNPGQYQLTFTVTNAINQTGAATVPLAS